MNNKNYFLIFPNQLFENCDYIKSIKPDKIFLLEHPKFFTRYSEGIKLNKLRVLYQKICFENYKKYITNLDICPVKYIELKSYKKFIKNMDKNNIYLYDIADRDIHNELKSIKNIIIKDSPSFILKYYDCDSFELCDYYSGVLKQTSFYSWIRKKLKILIDKKGNFVGKKLTYDTENRKQPNKEIIKIIPDDNLYKISEYNNALKYIDNNIDEKELNSIYFNKNNKLKFPVTHNDSKKVLKQFIREKLKYFGEYQDIILDDTNKSILFHSGISPMLNNGLLTPENVINEVLKQTEKEKINNIEGFIRQIIGWREFAKYIYEFHSEKYLNKNHFNCKNKLNKSWYNATTNIKPIDNAIFKAFSFGYLHHIERLMVISNYMLLCEIHPKEVFKWFTEFSLDSYDWVMEFNIYSMATYSDGGLMTTKPYISSSNYILKMSNYNKNKNEQWIHKWDKKFWTFMKKHKNKIKKIYRLNMLLKYADKNIQKLNLLIS